MPHASSLDEDALKRIQKTWSAQISRMDHHLGSSSLVAICPYKLAKKDYRPDTLHGYCQSGTGS